MRIHSAARNNRQAVGAVAAVRNPPPNYQPRWALLAAARRIDAANAHNNDFGGGSDLPFDGPEMLASDSDYNRNAGYLEEQAAFQQNDLCDGELLQFTNVYDKGYQAWAICWEHGQFTAQPSLGGVTSASLAVILFTRHQLHQEETRFGAD